MVEKDCISLFYLNLFLGDAISGGRFLFFLNFLQSLQFPFVPEEQLVPFIEVFLENNTDALGGKISLGIITVIRFVISFQADISRTVYQPFGLKVSHEISIGNRVVSE